MAECLRCVGGENSSPENVRRWTEKLSNVLLSSTARHKFKNYLISKELENEQALLEFWEMCYKFLLDTSSSNTGAADNTEILLEDAQRILQFAENRINFVEEMNPLNSAIASRNIGNIRTAVSEAKQIAAENLEQEGYQEFCRYLLKKAGLLRDGN